MPDSPKKRKRKVLKKKPIAASRLQLAEFVLLLNKSKTREEIIDEMGLNTNQFESLFNKYYSESETEQQNKTPLRIFTEIVGKKNQLVRDLEDLKGFLSDNKYKNAQAYVAAVKTQSDMLDELVKLGQALGLIIKTPEQVLLVGGKDVRDMDETERQMSIMKEMEQIRGMVAKTGTSKNKRIGQVIAFPGIDAQRESQP